MVSSIILSDTGNICICMVCLWFLEIVIKMLSIWIAKHFEEIFTAKMLFPRISVAIFLAVIIKIVDGNQTIVHVSESFGAASTVSCCVQGNCFCNSLDYALANLASNVLINITTDVTLSSLTKSSDLENVSIVGHNNPTVNCTNVGGIHFTFCHNCMIQGITWHGCGTDTDAEPGLQLKHSSNITIQNCSFQHSIGQAVVLSEVTGDANINHCQFVYNSHYRGHGAAVHYLSTNVTNHPGLLLKITNCNFTYNQGAKSLVYIENKNSEHNISISFYHFSFCHNQGTPIYVLNQTLNFNGKLLFLNNTAKLGAGIHISNKSAVIFGKEFNCST